jgi:hypothetical protein
MTLQIIDTAKASPVKPAIHSLEKLYTFRRPSEVSEYIDAHPFLAPLLVEAYAKIGEYFGPQPEVVLEVVNDPEVQGLVEMFGFQVTTDFADYADYIIASFREIRVIRC